jgi:hypothetical protein
MEQYKASHVDMLAERQRLTDKFGMIHSAKIAIKSEYMLSPSSSSHSTFLLAAHRSPRAPFTAQCTQGVRVLGHPFEAGRQGGDG